MPDFEHRSASDNLRAYIDSINDLQAPSETLEQVREMLVYAESVASSVERLSGSCERARPYAEMFLVGLPDGSAVWRCTHDPAHADIPA